MKILLATPLYPPEIGGPATYAKLLAEHLPHHDASLHVVPFSSVKKYPPLIRHFLFFLQIFKKIRHTDILFAQDVFSVGLPTFLAAIVTRKPFVVRVPGDFAWEQARVQYGVTDSIEQFQTKTNYPLKIRLYRFVERMIVRYADIVMTPSDYFSEIVRGWSKGVVPITVYNGIDSDAIASCVSDKKITKEFSIISSGRMVPWKGFRELIDLAVAQPAWRITLVGDGPDRHNLEAYARQKGVDGRVSFLGSLDQNTLWKTISLHDAFVLNSTFESFSFQLVEVMALGVPIVATGGSNIKEIITHEREGILIDSGSPQMLAGALERIAQDKDFRDHIVLCAKEKSVQFSITKTIEKLLSLLRTVSKEKQIVFVGTDRGVFDTTSRTYRRLVSYGSYAKRVTFIVPTSRNDSFRKMVVGNVTFIPTRNWHRIFFVSSIFFSMLKRARKGDIVSPQDPGFLGLIAFFVARIRNTKLYVQLHTDLFSPWYGTSTKKRAEQHIARFVLKRATKIRVVSPLVAKRVSTLSKAPLSIIPIVQEFTHNKEKKIVSDTTTFLVVARLESEKNIEGILRAFAEVHRSIPDTVLTIAGDGSLRTTFEKLADTLYISNVVKFVGFVKDPSVLYKHADVFVQNSWYEGYGLSLVEALSSGCPVISTHVGIADQVVLDGKNGILCPVGDQTALINAMKKMAENKPLREAMITELQEHPIDTVYTDEQSYIKTLAKFYE